MVRNAHAERQAMDNKHYPRVLQPDFCICGLKWTGHNKPKKGNAMKETDRARIKRILVIGLSEQDTATWREASGNGLTSSITSLAERMVTDLLAGEHDVSAMCPELCMCGKRANHGTPQEAYKPMYGD